MFAKQSIHVFLGTPNNSKQHRRQNGKYILNKCTIHFDEQQLQVLTVGFGVGLPLGIAVKILASHAVYIWQLIPGGHSSSVPPGQNRVKSQLLEASL
jgi:hypothetical protein